MCLANYRFIANRHYIAVSASITLWHRHNKMAAFGLGTRGASIMCAKVVRLWCSTPQLEHTGSTILLRTWQLQLLYLHTLHCQRLCCLWGQQSCLSEAPEKSLHVCLSFALAWHYCLPAAMPSHCARLAG